MKKEIERVKKEGKCVCVREREREIENVRVCVCLERERRHNMSRFATLLLFDI